MKLGSVASQVLRISNLKVLLPLRTFSFSSSAEYLKTQSMGFRLPEVVNSAKQLMRRSSSDVPKGYLAVYVGDESKMRRFVVPVSYLNRPSFQELLNQAEEEFGFDHPMGGLTIPCREDTFIDLLSCLSAS